MTQILAVHLPGDAAALSACVEVMRDALSDCPCDREDAVVAGDLALSCRLSSVAPEADRERLPRIDHAAALAITADVRLDDREALCRRLAMPDDATDGDLLFAAWRHWGQAALQVLHGDYAVVAADLRRGTLCCARDALGVRPMYYAMLGGRGGHDGIVIASDPRPLRAVLTMWNGKPPPLDSAYVAGFLRNALMWHPTATFERSIRKVPPGHVLHWRAPCADVRRWWTPGDIRFDAQASPEEAVAGVLPVLEQAVSDRLRTRLPVGVHLSGGLDSSITAALTVACLRARGAPSPPSWTWTPRSTEAPASAEVALLQSAARHLGLSPCHVGLSVADVLSFMQLDPVDLPIENTLLYERSTLAMAAGLGTRVIVTGWGGDEGLSFHGAAYHTDLLVRGRWLTLLAELRRMEITRVRDVLGLLLGPILRRAQIYRVCNGPGVLTPWAARTLRPLSHEGRPPALPRAQMLWRLTIGNLSGRLESYAAFGARHRVTYVHPLLDRRVLETVLGYGSQVFRRGRETRLLAKGVAATLLPDDVAQNRTKNDATRIPHLHAQIVEALCLLAGGCGEMPSDRARFVDAGWLSARMHSVAPEAYMRFLEAVQFAGVARQVEVSEGAGSSGR